MRSWNPRPPSRKLSERLFGGVEESLELALPLHSTLAWLTPATCALALALSFWMMRYEAAGGQRYLGANLLAPLPRAEFALAGSHGIPSAEPQWNTWTAAALDWSKVVFQGSETSIFASWHTNIHKL